MKPKTEIEQEILPLKSSLRENIEAIVVAVILALFIRTFIVQAFKIPSGSMEDTLLIGDHILVNKFIYGIRVPFSGATLIPVTQPDRGDIVVFKYPVDPSKDFIKRVIGVAGDRIKIKNKQVYVNDAPVANEFAIFRDPRTETGQRDNMAEVTVPENSIFVMGDNRDNSADSRYWGYVNLKAVKGKAFIIYWSWNSGNHESVLNYVRWGRIAHLLK